MNFIKTRPRLIGALSLTALGGVVAYLSHRRLARSCPRVPITELPKSSACRKLVEEAGEPTSQPPWGMKSSTLLSSWVGSTKTYWISSFTALQVEVPVSLLVGYGASHDSTSPNKGDDTYHLMKNFVAVFLDARATGPESLVLDKDVPSSSLIPGSLLFGRQSGLGAFLLGTWSSQGLKSVEPLELPSNAPLPCTEFPSNRDIVENSAADTAGAVLYWKFPNSLVGAIDDAASYGMPWRLMEGGFQEFIVERMSEDTARVTYVTVECTDLHPGTQSSRNFKMLPKLFYEAHVLYAQSLLNKSLRRLEIRSRVEK
ncbi:hypothetical protein P170DRAFT_354660 [Aspergillus steynii IBT 23096]|uniref:Uncharacterized protein n=1 Tax=Aspergillus steynii IBT 23096 TaxID=1392250 RepID=A0A2I2GAX4_9EURO|nr:uncharacterized protein P170DRAFT_354660 [Aspergillus steynii IBT 23096]PLB50031.1 hypothetical protein P170DRAFT_354660 [Aspergillus steynii IBT 23096]